MDEFLFWIIIIPIIFYILGSVFSKDKHPQDMDIQKIEDDNEDERNN